MLLSGVFFIRWYNITILYQFRKKGDTKMSERRVERERILLTKIAERDLRITKMEVMVGRLVLGLPNEDLEKINKMIKESLKEKE